MCLIFSSQVRWGISRPRYMEVHGGTVSYFFGNVRRYSLTSPCEALNILEPLQGWTRAPPTVSMILVKSLANLVDGGWAKGPTCHGRNGGFTMAFTMFWKYHALDTCRVIFQCPRNYPNLGGFWIFSHCKKKWLFARETLYTPKDVVPILLSSGGIGNAQHAHPQRTAHGFSPAMFVGSPSNHKVTIGLSENRITP